MNTFTKTFSILRIFRQNVVVAQTYNVYTIESQTYGFTFDLIKDQWIKHEVRSNAVMPIANKTFLIRYLGQLFCFIPHLEDKKVDVRVYDFKSKSWFSILFKVNYHGILSNGVSLSLVKA